MRHNSSALTPLLAFVLLLVVGLPARAVCTAGNPSANVIESTPTSNFTDNGNGTATHLKTGLMWKRCAEGQTWNGSTCTGTATTLVWADALKAANTANIAASSGYTDWRLPNIKELESIVEFCGYSPAINRTIFPAMPVSSAATSPFWSSSSYSLDPTNAWFVLFEDGVDDFGTKPADIFVRLVRGGQSVEDSFDLLTTPTATPQCTLTASPIAVTAGQASTLTATCNPAATSYAWTNTNFAATAATGTVSPTVTTTYSVSGSNAAGRGNTASATVTVCTYSLSPTTQIVAGTATTGTLSVITTAGCAWTATSNNPSMITITSGSPGSGNGTVVYAVAANPGTVARTGTLTIQGQTFTITQQGAAPLCTLTASPSTITAGLASTLTATCIPAASSYTWANTGFGASASGGSVSPTVTTTYSVSGSNFLGSGNTASATVTVTCTSLASSSQSVAAGASTGTLSVTAPAGCAWTASSNADWIAITAPASGNGNGTVAYAVAANPTGSPRIGTVTVGGQTFTVTQAGAVPACTLTAVPGTITAGQASILTATCNPAATSYAWTNIGFTATASTGSVAPTVTTTYSVIGSNTAGSGNPASATVTVAPCTYSLLPTSQSVAAGATTGTVNVTTTAGCAWTATSNNASMITITSGGNGNGNGTVAYAVSANPSSSSRTGTVTIGGQIFTLTQAGAVTFTSQSDCFFDWAQRTYPSLFSPAGPTSNTFPPYYYRYYPQTTAYLGTSTANNHVYYYGPSSNNTLYDAGALSGWLTTAGCQ